MNLFEYIDIYCERVEPSLFAEPLNALSNASFLIAAALLWKHYKTQQQKDSGVSLLIGLVAIVGVGSLCFHTFATRLAMLSDVIPITMFIFSYLWVAMRRMLALSKISTALWLTGFFLFSSALDALPSEYSLNGSASYFPSLTAILVFWLAMKMKAHPAAKHYFMAFMCFAFSLFFRSIDLSLCEKFPLGTHFFWHILNGLVLYLLTAALCVKPIHAK